MPICFSASFLRLLPVVVLASTSLLAQSFQGGISGTVRDAANRVVPGAKVTITNIDTGFVRTMSTNSEGYYTAPGLPLGTYEVKIAAPGFLTAVRSGIRLTVEQAAIMDVVLKVGAPDERIVVTAEAPMVDTSSPTLNSLVDENKVRDLPLNLRDVAQLTLLQPGIIQSRGGTRDINVGFGVKISVAGARPTENLFVMDGTDANDALNNTPAGASGAVTGVETIKEFRADINSMSAEHGRVGGGGVFNVVTKSGSNALHGSVFGFHRDDSLDARNFVDSEKPEFRRTQFGFTLGGPIRKNKTHFFGSYEGLREEKGITQTALVPGNIIRAAAPGATIRFADNTTAVLSANILPYLNLFPKPTGPDLIDSATGRSTQVAPFSGVLPRFSNEDFATGRIDHRFSDRDNMFGRYLFTNSEFLVNVLFPQYPNLDLNKRQLFTFGENHLFSNSVLNEFRFGFNRSTPQEVVPKPPTDLVLIQGRSFGSVIVLAGNNAPGLTEIGTDRTNPKKFFNNTFEINDNVDVEHGRHSFKTGALIEYFQTNAVSESRTRGRLQFSSLRNLVQDRPQRIEGATLNSDFLRHYREWLVGFYAQDNYRIHSRFTLFPGLRWEFVTTPSEKDGKDGNLTNFRDPNAVIIVSDRRWADPNAAVPVICCRKLFDNPTMLNIAPRLGFAWDLFGTNKTILRSGFGAFYQQPLFYVFRSPIFRSLPFAQRSRISLGGTGNPPQTVQSLPLNASAFAKGDSGPDNEALQFNLHRTYTLQYNLNLQQDLGWHTALTLGYIGSHGVNLFGQGDTNLANPVVLSDGRECFPSKDSPLCPASNTSPIRRNSKLGVVRTVFQGFSSSYNGLAVGVIKRATQGVTFQGSYTWSRCIDTRSGAAGRQEQEFGQSRTFDPFHPSLDRARCDFDVQHNFVFNHSIELPFGPQKRFGSSLTGIAARLAEGWQLSGILDVSSGIPFNVIVEGDPDRDGSDDSDNAARPNLVGDPFHGVCPNGSKVGTPSCWFNPNAFAFPLIGLRGNLSRNFLTGPGLATYDLAVRKQTRLSERVQMEFRAEAFNLFNHANLNPPINSDNGERIFSADGSRDQTAGVIGGERAQTATDAREIQLGIKFVF